MDSLAGFVPIRLKPRMVKNDSFLANTAVEYGVGQSTLAKRCRPLPLSRYLTSYQLELKDGHGAKRE